MRSRCRAREFSINSFQLSPERRRNLPRIALSQGDPTNVRGLNSKLASNTAEDPRLSGNSEKVLVGRDIFVGHNLAGLNSALLLPQNYCRSNNPESSKKEEAGVPSLPLWAAQIDKLLKSQRLTQQAFAAKMNVTQGSVSAWISGRKEPKPEMYFRMAKLWPSAPDVAHWLKRASDLSGAFQVDQSEPAISQRKTATSTRRVKFGKLSSEAVEIPLLKDPAATGTPRQVNENEIEDFLAFPGSLCPHPDEIVCIKVQGDSMSPLLEDGYIVAVDTSQTDRARLHGQMVAARDPEGGVTIKWLRKVGKQEILLPQHTSKRHQPIILSPLEEQDTGWAVVGRVLWWIGMPS
jgi:SOS-response transcriptional repressor LexA/DNA-binding transcriptional regulator YiaG